MPKQILTNLDFTSGAKIVNLPTPSASGDAVNKAYVDSAIEGLNWKDSVRAASVANLNLSSMPSAVDGITLTNGDRFLAKDQTTQSQNGIYIFNGAAAAATRAADASTSAELEQAVVVVEEGTTNAATTWRQTQVNFTLDTNNVIFTSFGTSAPAASETVSGIAEIATQAETDTGTDDLRIVTPLKLANYANKKLKLAQNIGDGSSTQIDVTHNFNTINVVVQVFRNGTPWDNVECDIERPNANTARLRFATAPTSNQYTVLVLG